jgi:hypothetical protein
MDAQRSAAGRMAETETSVPGDHLDYPRKTSSRSEAVPKLTGRQDIKSGRTEGHA